MQHYLYLRCFLDDDDWSQSQIFAYWRKTWLSFVPNVKTNPINLLFSLQMLSSLSLKSTIVTYEGSPAFPAIDSLWDIAAKHHVTHLGTSPKYISACMRAGVEPGGRNDLQLLRTILSTGSPLPSELYDWIYSHVKVWSELYFHFIFCNQSSLFSQSTTSPDCCGLRCSVMYIWLPLLGVQICWVALL